MKGRTVYIVTDAVSELKSTSISRLHIGHVRLEDDKRLVRT